jgi:hypothetical protein
MLVHGHKVLKVSQLVKRLVAVDTLFFDMITNLIPFVPLGICAALQATFQPAHTAGLLLQSLATVHSLSSRAPPR